MFAGESDLVHTSRGMILIIYADALLSAGSFGIGIEIRAEQRPIGIQGDLPGSCRSTNQIPKKIMIQDGFCGDALPFVVDGEVQLIFRCMDGIRSAWGDLPEKKSAEKESKKDKSLIVPAHGMGC
jgi:hypothetical protein